MRRFLLFLNRGKEHVAEKIASIWEQLLLLGAELADIEEYDIAGTYGEDYDCVLTLGDDGTLVRATRGLAGNGVPLADINLGHLGRPTMASSDEGIPGVLEKLIADDYIIEERMMLNGRVIWSRRESPRDHE